MRDPDELVLLATEPPDIEDWDTDEICVLLVEVDDLYRLVRDYRNQLTGHLGGILDDLVTVGNNTAVTPDRTERVTDTAGQIRDKVLPQLRHHYIDPETGDRVEAVNMDDVREFLDVRKTAKRLRPFGVKSTWVTTVKVIR